MEENKTDQSQPESDAGAAPTPPTPVLEPPVATPAKPSPTPPSASKLKQVHHKLLSNKKLLTLVSLVILLIAGSAVYWFIFKSSNKPVSSSSQTKSQTKQTAIKNNLPAATLLSGNSYLDTPKALPDLHFFKNADAFGQTCTGENGTDCGPSIQLTDITYYQIGTTKDSQKIIIFSLPNGIASANYFALGNTDGSYSVLLQMDTGADSDQSSFSSNVTLDKTTQLNDFTFPANVTVNGQQLSTSYGPNANSGVPEGYGQFMTNGLVSIRGDFRGDLQGTTPQKIADIGGFSYYRVVPSDQNTFQIIEIYATYKNLFSALYTPAGEIASTQGNLKINWTSGDNNSSTYFSGGSGCSTAGYVIAKNIVASDLVAVGKTPKGQTVYQVSTNTPLVQEIFDKDYAAGQYLDDKSLQNLTIQQMTDKHAYFLAQNGFNEYVLFQRDDMFARGGCAKPVIYLYPQQTTNVSVRVGAQITRSAPSYGADGWKNVIAQPDGTLSYHGSYFPNLFWEGYGNGVYPAVNSGTVVKSSDAANTVMAQLAQQGLKPNEINDFMNFWSPKLVTNKPYIRLTWFNTPDMNRLAPLNVSPTPRTTIRVFLDFEALDKPYNLPAQKLSAPQRLGFTVVEWGGLLRNGLN